MTVGESLVDSYLIIPLILVGIPMVAIIIALFIELIKIAITEKK